MQLNIATYDLTLLGLTTNWGQIRGVAGSKKGYPSVIDIESIIPVPSTISSPISILTNKANAVIDVAVIRDNGIKNNDWALTNPYVSSILNQGTINVDKYFNAGQMRNNGIINFRDWGKFLGGSVTNGSNVFINEKPGKINFGANSTVFLGDKFSQRSIFNYGTVTFKEGVKINGGSNDYPAIVNSGGKIIFSGNSMSGMLANYGSKGDGSGLFGSANFTNEEYTAYGNLMPGTSSAQGSFTFNGFNGNLQRSVSHEFDLFYPGSSDYLMSTRNAELNSGTVLDLNWRGKGTISTNSRFSIFKTKSGTNNLTGQYLNSDEVLIEEGGVVDYVAKGSSANTAAKLYITYQGGGGSDIELYTAGVTYNRGSSKADVITGTKGTDVYQGLSGNDYLIATEGIDDYYGGEGADEFLAKKGEGHMVIHDFNPDEGDILRMAGGGLLRATEDLNDSGTTQYFNGSDLVAIVPSI